MVHVARQAILDARGHVVGYELLYRGSVRDTACTVEGDVAGATVLTGAMLDLRLETLTDGRTPFINITRSMLLNDELTAAGFAQATVHSTGFTSTTTVSMCGVWGNMSTGCIEAIVYPCCAMRVRSRASVSGLHET